MATINWDTQSGNDPGWDGAQSAPTTDPASRPTQRTGQSRASIFGDIANVYKSALGRDADRIGYSEYLNWANDLGGDNWGFKVADWENQIRNSAEAKAYTASQANRNATTTTAGSGDWKSFGQAWLGSGGKTVADLEAFIAANPQFGATLTGSKRDKVTIGGRTFDAVRSAGIGGGLGASWDDITDGGPTNTSSNYGNSASTELYVNEILSRLKALRQPINDPMTIALQRAALERVQGLQGAPYTAGEDAALIARYREPVTQARDVEYQRNREEASRRGFMASSGLLDVLDQATNRAYQGAVAQGANDLGVQAVAEKQRRGQEALAILASLVQNETAQRNEMEQRSQELVRTASLLPGMDERRLQLLLDASNAGTASTNSALSNLLQLGRLNQSSNQTNNANAQNNSATFGAYLARILAALGQSGGN